MSTAPTILTIAFPFAPVGPAAVGGAEVLLSQVEAALPSLGFRSVVVAHAVSRPVGQLYPVHVPGGEITDAVRAAAELLTQAQIDRACAENPVALVHMHGLDFARYRTPEDVPVLVTLHLPPAWYPDTLWNLPPRYTLVCVSETQRHSCPAHLRDRIRVIGNGVPLPDANTLRSHGRYALMMARICPEKNLHTALDAARLAGMPAVLAGEVFPYPAHLRYFAEEIEPRLSRQGLAHETRAEIVPSQPEARFLGAVGGAAKDRLIARAACLLLPSLAPETSSLVAMEALAAGVPVIAMASGAVPEIVEEGRTGFLIPPGEGPEAVQAMAAALRRLPQLDRTTCRAAATERFSLPQTLASYAELYHRLARTIPVAETLISAAFEGPALQNEGAPQTTSGPIRIDHLTASTDLDALIPAWTTLWQDDPDATPFQHPAWLCPWWRQFGPDGDLHALALHTEQTNQLLGFLPLYVYKEPETRERKLLLLGAGTTDYLDGIWSPSCRGAASEALTYALQLRDLWDTAHFPQLRLDSPLLLAAQKDGLPTRLAEPTSIIDLRTELPPRLRANIGRYRRRAAAMGELLCTVADNSTEALENFELLLRFHAARWNEPGEAGVLSDPRVHAHHRQALPALQEAGLLRFFRLTLEDRALGVLYALADPPQRTRRSLYLYLIGFDTDASDFSPGTLLLHEVRKYAQAKGFNAMDLLRGGELYKHLWGAQVRPTYAIDLSPQVSAGN